MIDRADLHIDTYRAQGPNDVGDWAVRVTHLPSDIEVVSQGRFADGEDPATALAEAREKVIAQLEAN